VTSLRLENAPLTFGVFDQIEYDGRPAGETYEDHLRLMELADRAGFYCYHVSEHHGTPLSLSTSPSLILAAASQPTERIRLAPLVYTLPYYNPYRLANEICMLDQLSGGRIELGLGRGISPIEGKFFGVTSLEDSRAIYRESFDILLKAFTSDTLDFKGEYYSYSDLPLWVHTVQKPYPPLWFPSSNEESIPFTAGQGLNTVLNNTFATTRIKALVEQYHETWEAHRNDEGRMNAHVGLPKVGLSVKVFVGPTDEQAERSARSAFKTWGEHINYLYSRAGTPRADDRANFEQQRANGTLLVGTAGTVAAEVSRVVEETGINYLLCSFAFGDLPPEDALLSMERFAEEVLPHGTQPADGKPSHATPEAR
jgi:alkanesulfonate monooxygenase SsuD/methylene tetrahydromethanopterin reductase-like flavin-dependent oxidoreductase (luciferase family)